MTDCYFYYRGHCAQGDNCHFLHSRDVDKPEFGNRPLIPSKTVCPLATTPGGCRIPSCPYFHPKVVPRPESYNPDKATWDRMVDSFLKQTTHNEPKQKSVENDPAPVKLQPAKARSPQRIDHPVPSRTVIGSTNSHRIVQPPAAEATVGNKPAAMKTDPKTDPCPPPPAHDPLVDDIDRFLADVETDPIELVEDNKSRDTHTVLTTENQSPANRPVETLSASSDETVRLSSVRGIKSVGDTAGSPVTVSPVKALTTKRRIVIEDSPPHKSDQRHVELSPSKQPASDDPTLHESQTIADFRHVESPPSEAVTERRRKKADRLARKELKKLAKEKRRAFKEGQRSAMLMEKNSRSNILSRLGKVPESHSNESSDSDRKRLRAERFQTSKLITQSVSRPASHSPPKVSNTIDSAIDRTGADSASDVKTYEQIMREKALRSMMLFRSQKQAVQSRSATSSPLNVETMLSAAQNLGEVKAGVSHDLPPSPPDIILDEVKINSPVARTSVKQKGDNSISAPAVKARLTQSAVKTSPISTADVAQLKTTVTQSIAIPVASRLEPGVSGNSLESIQIKTLDEIKVNKKRTVAEAFADSSSSPDAKLVSKTPERVPSNISNLGEPNTVERLAASKRILKFPSRGNTRRRPHLTRPQAGNDLKITASSESQKAATQKPKSLISPDTLRLQSNVDYFLSQLRPDTGQGEETPTDKKSNINEDSLLIQSKGSESDDSFSELGDDLLNELDEDFEENKRTTDLEPTGATQQQDDQPSETGAPKNMKPLDDLDPVSDKPSAHSNLHVSIGLPTLTSEDKALLDEFDELLGDEDELPVGDTTDDVDENLLLDD